MIYLIYFIIVLIVSFTVRKLVLPFLILSYLLFLGLIALLVAERFSLSSEVAIFAFLTLVPVILTKIYYEN